jgi:hypothetical protein
MDGWMDGWILFRPEALSLKGLGTLNTYNPDRFSHLQQLKRDLLVEAVWC